jgi:hypothetical protein
MPEYHLILTAKRVVSSGLKVQVLVGEWRIFVGDIGQVQ